MTICTACACDPAFFYSKMQSVLQQRLGFRHVQTPSKTRGYAISVKPSRPLPGRTTPRVFKEKKAFQYNWYTRILKSNTSSPLLILYHDDFTAQRLKKLRSDIAVASQKAQPSLS